ncbi:MAG: tRNA/rRNA methyltransferase [Bacteroidales bacterium]|nr:tRNA/rRNA methyltransferase [Bacteroidales bacterium]
MHISFILVEPKVPENIGAAARAIKTMGFDSLVLVQPCEYKSIMARRLAHGSHDILDRAHVYPSLKEAIVDMDIVIGTTARYRNTRGVYIDIKELKPLLEKQDSTCNKAAVIFGPEESGLSNTEIALCDIISTIPMAASFPSLNLSQAVMLYAYTLGRIEGEPVSRGESGKNPDSIRLLKKKIDFLLSGTSIHSNKALKGKIMERLSLADGKDLNLLHSIANTLIDKYGKEGL